MILAGIDEAGYGPTLGPLVVSASVFRLGEPSDQGSADEPPDLWKVLEPAVCRKPDGRRLPINDSKKLFSQKKGPCNLEEGLLPFIYLEEKAPPRDLRSLLRYVTRGHEAGEPADTYLDRYPWYRDRNVDLPVDTFENVVRNRARKLRSTLRQAGVEHIGLVSRPVEVFEFNRELESRENKSSVSFDVIGSFLERLWRRFPTETVEVVVDRQGGRIRYGPLLFERLRPKSVRIEAQSEELSSYCLRRKTQPGSPKDFRVIFATESEERHLPVALASMLSKYLREVHMILFNRFWRELREDLRPTAGYALDARRFLKDIQPLRRRLGIDDALLVRRR